MTIEQLLKKLKETVDKMESEDISMEESLRLFEEGTALVKQCFDAIEQYKGKLTYIKSKLIDEN
jgi:exodeoxyribonuclease VII small subunit